MSIIVEGYNEKLSFESIDTLKGLKRQTFPLDQVELILVGDSQQAGRWRETGARSPFFGVKVVAADGAHYFQLKNLGAQAASGEILVFTDSDVYADANWLATIVEGIRKGAEVVGGVTLFGSKGGRSRSHPVLLAAGSITWGGNVFQAHNVGIRADTFRRHRYRVDLGRTGAGYLQYRELARSGARMVLQPEQRVWHSFTPRWWLLVNVRYGYESMLLRRLDESWPHRWVAKTSVFEPLLTTLWRIALDVPQWFRYGRRVGLRMRTRVVLLPLLVAMSVVARGLQMVGMYASLLAHRRMKQFAESH